MSMTTEHPPSICPSWCVRDQREDGPDFALDPITWHYAAPLVVHTSRGTELSLELQLYDPDHKEPGDPGSQVTFFGDDGSGSLMQLDLAIEDTKPVALALLRLAEMVDGERAEVVR